MVEVLPTTLEVTMVEVLPTTMEGRQQRLVDMDLVEMAVTQTSRHGPRKTGTLSFATSLGRG
jgi:hypothetical protein